MWHVPWRRTTGLVVATLLGCGRLLAAEPAAEAAPPADDWPAQRDETFDVVWQTVNESYYDPTFGGLDWKALGDRYRARLPEVKDKSALRWLLQSMLGELRKTHFSIVPREMSVFTPAERKRSGTVGLTVVFVDGVVAVTHVDAASAAAKAGLKQGDQLLRIDDLELGALAPWLEKENVPLSRQVLYVSQLANSRLRGPVESAVHLQVKTSAGEERAVQLEFADFAGVWSEPMGDFPSLPVEVEAECPPDGLAYVHFNVFARAAMKDIRALLHAVPPGGGLVIDLRGNGGGLALMASGISGWLSERSYLLGTMYLRQGVMSLTVSPQKNAFLGPVAILVDGTSASTSEIMAAGLQEIGRARVFGEPSPGAALPSLFKSLPSGDMLQYAIAEMQTPGRVPIEGRGVTPNETVHRSVADLAAGHDPVVEAARRWLEAQRQAEKAPPSPH